MGLVDDCEPPKKKLKQAQLCFTPKGQKRKLVAGSDDDVPVVKIPCKETISNNEKVNVCDKENVFIEKPLSVGADNNSDSDVVVISPEKNQSPKKCFDKKTESSKETVAPSLPSESSTEPTNTDLNSSNTQDFSLSLSESVLVSINKPTSADVSPTTTTICNRDLAVTTVESLSRTSSISSGDGLKSDSLKTDTDTNVNNSLCESNDESDLNKTLDTEDEDAWNSSFEENEKTVKSSPASNKKLTPKRIESAKKKEERIKLRLEKQEQRTKLKEEKLRKAEEKKKEREQKRLADQKLKEEERKVKEEEKKKRDEEKKQKEEEKRLKEEEKRKREEAKEEEKKRKEEIEERKKAAFAKFFKKSKQPDASEKTEDCEDNTFMPFPMKPDMKLANEPRRILVPEEKKLLDSILLGDCECDTLYLGNLKSGKYIPNKTEATWPLSSLEEEEHDDIIIESTENGDCIDLTNCEKRPKKKQTKAKLLQFHDNRRPPYWGTWRKKSKSIGPRRPLGQDKDVFDYEVDSDSEWEDEGEGEDIEKEADSDGEQSGDEEVEAQGENGYLLDNTFVPHGYLSDEEVNPDEDIEDNDPENLKNRMKILKQEFDEEMKSKTERLRPRLLGCVWISNGITEISSGSLYEKLMSYRAVWNEEEGPIDVTSPVIEDSPTITPQPRKIFPPAVLSTLVKFIHGSNLSFATLFKELVQLIEKEHPTDRVSKRAIQIKIKEVASKSYENGKRTWVVNSSLCQQYDLKPITTDQTVSSPVPVPPTQTMKSKDNGLMNYLKSPHTPPPTKKKVPFVTLASSSFDYTPSKFTESGVKDFGTPRPVNSVIKKRAQLITLSTNIKKEGEKITDSGPSDIPKPPLNNE